MSLSTNNAQLIVPVNWRNVPFLKLALGFFAGTMIARLTALQSANLVLIAGIPLLLLGVFGTRLPHYLRWPVVLIAIGYLGYLNQNLYSHSSEIAKSFPVENLNTLTAICKDHSHKAYGTQLILKPTVIAGPDMGMRSLLVAFVKDSLSVGIGDTVKLKSQIRKFNSPDFVPGFDISRYYASKGIYHYCWPKSEDIEILRSSRFRIQNTARRIRDSGLHVLRKHIPGDTARAIASAMILGDRNGLTTAIRTTFQKTGAMHILAISGLHVGIVASLVIILTKTLSPRGGYLGRVLPLAISLITVWSFTFVSGLAPSAVRASLMLTLYFVARLMRRRAALLNILSFCFVLSLSIDPSLVDSVSFQFSYLALTGIAVTGRPIFRLIPLKNPLLRATWGVIAISISAQVFLIPLIMYYFNELSVVGPLTSIVAIPAAYITVCLTLAMFAIHPVIPQITSELGRITEFIIDLLFRSLDITNNALPGTIENICLTGTELLLLFAILAAFGLRIMSNRRKWYIISIAAAIAFSIIHIHTVLSKSSENCLTIYKTKDQYVFDIIEAGRVWTNLDNESLNSYDLSKINRNRIQHYARLKSPTHHIIEPPAGHNNNTDSHLQYGTLVQIKNRGILILYEAPENIDQIVRDLQLGIVVLSPSIRHASKMELKIACQELGIRCHDLAADGDFHLVLNESS